MNRTWTIIIAIVLIVGVIWYVRSNRATTTTVPTSTDTTATGTTIDYQNGFSPSTTTVQAGSTVTFKNDSSRAIQVQSDPHPAHTDNPELNVGTIDAGSSKTITVTTVGDWGFHNHLNPSETGRITVQ